MKFVINFRSKPSFISIAYLNTVRIEKTAVSVYLSQIVKVEPTKHVTDARKIHQFTRQYFYILDFNQNFKIEKYFYTGNNCH